MDLPALKVDAPYRFSFETKDNVPHPLKVVSSQITTLESGKVLKPHFKFICAAYDPGVKAPGTAYRFPEKEPYGN